MKYILLLLLLIPEFLKGQAPIKANQITISSEDYVKTTYERVKATLQEDGYLIEKCDDNFRTITTAPKVIDESMAITLSLSVNNNADISLNGKIFIPNVGLSQIENLGMRGSPSKIAWAELERMAKLLGKRRSYGTLPEEQ